MSQKSIHHLLKINRQLQTLLNMSSYDNVVLSLVATEMFFRGFVDRVLEYMAWIVLGWIYPKKVERLSVGIAQVQLRHWLSMGYIDSLRPSLKALLTVTNPAFNYQACNGYLKKMGYKRGVSPSEVARLYVGEVRKYYVLVLNKALKIWNARSDKASQCVKSEFLD